MKLFRRLFAEKILKFHEGTNKVFRTLMNIPIIKDYLNKDIFDKEQSGLRTAFGVLGQICVILWEFARKYIYAIIFMYLPFRIISRFCPLVASHQELAMVYMFVMLSTICGSLANNTLLAMGDRDYLMIKVMMISPYMNFLGKLIYKIATDFIYFTIILCILDVSVYHSIMLGLVTACARPIGEMFAIISYDRKKTVYERRNTYNGAIMAASVLLAYGLPILTRRISAAWMAVVHPSFVMVMFLLGAGAMYYLWWYKSYKDIIREAMHMKREN
ncbi:MAG: hypothetical protein Q4F11_06125 [Eubacteriales bacterium]|nr:hypothetical protein [Eubacteriales bacterium]